MPIGTVAEPMARRLRSPRPRSYTFLMPAGLAVGVTITTTFVAKTRGLVQRPSLKSCVGIDRFADRKTSAGAPLRICRARASEPAKLYVGEPSILGRASRSEAAADTVSADAEAGAASAATASASGASRRVRRGRSTGLTSGTWSWTGPRRRSRGR